LFCLSQHIIDEAMKIAAKLHETGEQLGAIRSTGLFVARNVCNDFIELHELAIDGTSYFIVQRLTNGREK
jgi:hypothetical protein